MTEKKRREILRKLDKLAEQYGTDVFGDSQIGELVKEVPELSKYQDIFQQFAENGLYNVVLKKLDRIELPRYDLNEMTSKLVSEKNFEISTVSWICYTIWQVVKFRSIGLSVKQAFPQSEHIAQNREVEKVSTPQKTMSTGKMVICVMRMLLGVLLLAGIAYHAGVFSLLTRVPEEVWNLFPIEVQNFIQKAPQFSPLWAPDDIYINISLMAYAKQALLRGFYTGAIISSPFACLILIGDALKDARKGKSFAQQLGDVLYGMFSWLLLASVVMCGVYLFLMLP